MASNGLMCADVPLSNYSLTHFLRHRQTLSRVRGCLWLQELSDDFRWRLTQDNQVTYLLIIVPACK